MEAPLLRSKRGPAKRPPFRYSACKLTLGTLHLINFIITAVYAAREDKVYGMGYLAYQANGTITVDTYASIGWVSLEGVRLKWIAAAYFFITSMFDLCEGGLAYFSNTEEEGPIKNYRGYYMEHMKKQRHNYVRFTEYTLTLPLMSLIVTRVAGQHTVTGWLLLGACVIAMVWAMCEAERSRSWAWFFKACFFGAVLLAHDLVLVATASYLPPAAYTLIFLNDAFYLCLGGVAAYELTQARQEVPGATYAFTFLVFFRGAEGDEEDEGEPIHAGRIGATKGKGYTYAFTEKLYWFFAFVAKTVLGYQLLFALK